MKIFGIWREKENKGEMERGTLKVGKFLLGIVKRILKKMVLAILLTFNLKKKVSLVL